MSLPIRSEAAATLAGLRYVETEAPGIRRLHHGTGFRYVNAQGRPIRNAVILERIRRLAIPPAWTDVWICSSSHGHIQAIGRDARRRKQYRYHDRWRGVRDANKYHRLVAFARALPRIRRRIRRDLRRPGLSRHKVLATIVRLLETTLIRVGNDEYLRHNGSVGLTTMRDRHVDIRGRQVRFCFRGKSGIRHCIDLHDVRLARIIKQCQELPGQQLFQYWNDDGRRQAVASDDVNEYLRHISGQDFTAKDFRTWAGTVLAVQALRAIGSVETARPAKKHLLQAIDEVAKRLGNTRAICRKCYIHPDILTCYLDGSLLPALQATQQSTSAAKLTGDERMVLAFLQRRVLRTQAGRPTRRAS